VSGDLEAGVFCASTEHALARFQAERGLRPTGVCDEDSWKALVEASWKLGDRLLTLVAPNLRGDDVAELQEVLARLGFDPGRADGIFGPTTARALEDFQRNSGLYVDGVCGPVTVRALHVLARQTGTGPGVSVVRELEALTATARALADMRIVVGQFGGLSGLTRQLVHALRQRSAMVVASDEPDASAQAAAANRFAASVYIGFETQPDERSTIHYFAVPHFESAGGRALAHLVAAHGRELIPGFNPEVAGMRLQVLRETRMPAVLIVLGSLQRSLDHTPEVVSSVVAAVEAWADGPLTRPEADSARSPLAR
jgi:N-acetylmuramoyl-L-alanine amidase